MRSHVKNAFLVTTVILILTPQGEALKCYACAGGLESSCYALSDLKIIDCAFDKVCVRYESDYHVERSCSPQTMGNGLDICSNVKYKTCSTCSTDLCNNSNIPAISILVIVGTLLCNLKISI